MLDMAIIGCGPAGLSAAINGRARGKEVKVFGVKLCSPALHKAHRIDNYLGFPEIRGDDLRKLFLDHARSMGVVPDTESVTAVYPMGDYFELQLRRENLQARTLIITTGVSVARPIPWEEEFIGRGVSYCATCDGNFYKGKKVAVIADSPEGEEEVNFLAELAAAIWYIPLYQGEYNLRGNLEVLEDRPVEVVGGQRLEKLVLKSGRSCRWTAAFPRNSCRHQDSAGPGTGEKPHQGQPGHVHQYPRPLCRRRCNRALPAGQSCGRGQIAALSAAKYLDSLA